MSIQKKLFREGDYLAEVEITLRDPDAVWGPHLLVEEARELDEVRMALRRGDFAKAAKLARVYRLTPVYFLENSA